MAQIFHPSTNTISKVTIFGAIFFLAGVGVLGYIFVRSSFMTRKDIVVEQPVPFSHEHHVDGLGIDCRYCHTTVEQTASAGIPPTKTCMTCHSQIWSTSPILEPVRDSWRTGQPIEWVRVYDLPDFVYFNHSIHVAKGVGCETCHGRIDRMPLVWKAVTLQMEWCLECHRHPERSIRPRAQIYTMGWQPAQNQEAQGTELSQAYHIQTHQLTDCTVCHR